MLEIHGDGGPPNEAILPWDGFQTHRDRSMYRSPQSRALQQVKGEIQAAERWDDFKKITNPYEYVHLSWNRRSSSSVAARHPLSRSYFKMVEMWEALDFQTHLEPLVTAGGLKTAHAAEGPGGFIEACLSRAEKLGWTHADTHAITLKSDATNIPGWRKASRFLEAHPTVHIHEGADGTGNILLKVNQDSFVRASLGAHIYTADGGFDFSSDYNAQEDTIFSLLVAEALLGLRCLSVGGIMVLKCFDTTERNTLDLLWLLTRAFSAWHIVKPHTSRAGNAERYFVGMGRLPVIDDIVMFLESIQKARLWNCPLLTQGAEQREWLKRVFELQEAIEAQEYRIIRLTLDLMQTPEYRRIYALVAENVTRSVEWCRRFGEDVSSHWLADNEKKLARETRDLIALLTDTPGASSAAWYNRTGASVKSLTFEGFRGGKDAMPSTMAITTAVRFGNFKPTPWA